MEDRRVGWALPVRVARGAAVVVDCRATMTTANINVQRAKYIIENTDH
jgi:hypothetical protein